MGYPTIAHIQDPTFAPQSLPKLQIIKVSTCMWGCFSILDMIEHHRKLILIFLPDTPRWTTRSRHILSALTHCPILSTAR